MCRRPALRPRQDRGVRPLRRTGMVPAQTTTRTPTTDFRGSIPRLGTRCLRLAAWVTPPPRKTRFRSLARRFRTGFHPQGSNERFPSLRLHLILLSQACVTQGSFRNFMLTGDPVAGYDSSAIKRHWMPLHERMRMSKNSGCARSGRCLIPYNTPGDRFAARNTEAPKRRNSRTQKAETEKS